MKVLTRLFGLTTILAVAGIHTAMAEDVECPPNLIANFDGDVIVVDRDGQPCTLDGLTIGGNVKIESGGNLLVKEGTLIKGSVQTIESEATRVRIRDSEVNGNVQLQDMLGWQNSVIANSTIGADLELQANEANPGARFVIRNNAVDGNVKVFDNTYEVAIGGRPGNVIGGNLECQNNDPAPVDIGRNEVDGSKEEQCEGF